MHLSILFGKIFAFYSISPPYLYFNRYLIICIWWIKFTDYSISYHPQKHCRWMQKCHFFDFFQSSLHHFVNNLLINAIALHFFLPFFSRSAKTTIRNTAKTRRKITSSARIIFSFYIFISYFSLFSWHYPKNMLLYLSVNRMRTKYAEIFRHRKNRKTTNI